MAIRQLAPDVAAKIAAGEVVERPASVVKELIENSIDAGATQIRVDLTNGGLQLIRVSDNGSGIPSDELSLALARHATSKVAQIDDLEHIRSLGFRGEALASVAAVADVTLLSRLRGAEQGAQISATNGQLSEVSTAASPEGTTLTVRNLFSAVPARLKFLKSRNTEVSHCHHLLEQYALAYPEIRFSVFSDGRQILSTPGDGQLSSVLVEIYGVQVAEQMIPVRGLHSDDAGQPQIHGYTSRPVCYKSTRQYISFFVNRRWVLSRVLTAAVEEAYHSLLLTGRHPIAVINIQLDPSLLDVNVHPAKTEIRFLKERRVFAAILRAVRQALLEEPEMPEWNSHPVGTDLSRPANHADEQTVGTAITPDTFTTEEEPSSILSTSPIPSDNPWLTFAEEDTGTKPPLLSRLWQSHIRQPETSPSGKIPARSSASTPIDWDDTSTAREAVISDPALQGHAQASQGSAQTAQSSEAVVPRDDPGKQVEANSAVEIQSKPTVMGQLLDGQMGRRLPKLRVIGQLSQSYIVTEGNDGMYLIDQHAAHERILLERMVAAIQSRQPVSQLLLTPMTLKLAPPELEAIEEHLPRLEHIGFALEVPDHATLLVQGVPSVLVKQMNARSVHELLLELTSPENLGHTETWEEHALANVACKAAIKANYFLTVSEMREMLEQLEQTKAPFSCCHGRPTMIHFGLTALAHEFERR